MRLPDMGLKTGTVELVPDTLPEDDTRHFVIDFLRKYTCWSSMEPLVRFRIGMRHFLRAALQPGVIPALELPQRMSSRTS